MCLDSKGTTQYLGLRLHPQGEASMKNKPVLHAEALVSWCRNKLRPASVSHQVLATMIGGIVRYAAPYLSDGAADVVQLNFAMKAMPVRFER